MGADTAQGFDGALSFSIGSADISLSALAVASIAGILLNAILPGKDYNFSEEEPKDTGVNFSVGANSKRQEREAKDAE